MTTPAERFISRKIGILRDEGYPEKQAIAIAYSMAREAITSPQRVTPLNIRLALESLLGPRKGIQ